MVSRVLRRGLQTKRNPFLRNGRKKIPEIVLAVDPVRKEMVATRSLVLHRLSGVEGSGVGNAKRNGLVLIGKRVLILVVLDMLRINGHEDRKMLPDLGERCLNASRPTFCRPVVLKMDGLK